MNSLLLMLLAAVSTSQAGVVSIAQDGGAIFYQDSTCIAVTGQIDAGTEVVKILYTGSETCSGTDIVGELCFLPDAGCLVAPPSGGGSGLSFYNTGMDAGTFPIFSGSGVVVTLGAVDGGTPPSGATTVLVSGFINLAASGTFTFNTGYTYSTSVSCWCALPCGGNGNYDVESSCKPSGLSQITVSSLPECGDGEFWWNCIGY